MSQVQAETAPEDVLADSADQAEIILKCAEGVLKQGDVKFTAAMITTHGYMLSLLEMAEEAKLSDREFRKMFIRAFKPIAEYVNGMLDEKIAQL